MPDIAGKVKLHHILIRGDTDNVSVIVEFKLKRVSMRLEADRINRQLECSNDRQIICNRVQIPIRTTVLHRDADSSDSKRVASGFEYQAAG